MTYIDGMRLVARGFQPMLDRSRSCDASTAVQSG